MCIALIVVLSVGEELYILDCTSHCDNQLTSILVRRRRRPSTASFSVVFNFSFSLYLLFSILNFTTNFEQNLFTFSSLLLLSSCWASLMGGGGGGGVGKRF